MTVAPCPLTVHCWGDPDITFSLTPLKYLKTAITSSLNPSPRQRNPASGPWGHWWALLALAQPAPTLPMGPKTSFHLCQRLLVPTSAMSQRSPTLPPEQTLDAHCSLVSNPALESGSTCSCWPLWVVPGLGSSPCHAWAVNGSHYQHPALPARLRHCGAHQWRTTTSVGVTSTPCMAPLRVAQLLLLPRPLSFKQNPQYIHSYVWT